jgi:glycosyltransferase involved in cell wall biosynthesis
VSLRILHVVASDQRRGAEVFAADLVRTLGERGVSQRMAVLRSGSAATTYEVPVVDLKARRPVPIAHVDPGACARLARVVRDGRPHLVQVHGGEALKYAACGMLRARTPIVYRRIGGAPLWMRRGAQRRVYSALMRRPALIVTVAEAIRAETIALFGVAPVRVVTIPNGVDASRMRPSRTRASMRRELGVPTSAPVVLSLVSLTWEKDPLTHIAVASRVLDDVPGAVHVIAGDGPMRSEVEGEIRRRGLSRRVRVLGLRSDVADLMHASDVLLFASRPDGMEGMPAVVIEAGMSALAVAGFDVAGVSEVVEHDGSGLLVPWGDVDGLAASVSRLLRSDRVRRSMGKAARERCARFDVRAMAGRYVDVYEEVIGR